MSYNSFPFVTQFKENHINRDFTFLFGNLQIDKCPICLKFNAKAMEISCRNCLIFVCKYCYKKSSSTSCPVCKTPYALQGTTFKEKKILESLEAECNNCQKKLQVFDNFTIIKHKIECFITDWKIVNIAGEPNEIEDLVDYLILNVDDLYRLPENFLEFAEKMQNNLKVSWNIFFTKFSNAKSKQILSIQMIGQDHQLLFLLQIIATEEILKSRMSDYEAILGIQTKANCKLQLMYYQL